METRSVGVLATLLLDELYREADDENALSRLVEATNALEGAMHEDLIPEHVR